MNTFHCAFLGCKVNQYDAERARGHLVRLGFRETAQEASLLLLASCTVTGTAARKGRQAVRSLLRKHEGAEVVVMGCLTDEDRQFYESMTASVTVLPSARTDQFLEGLTPVTNRIATTSLCVNPEAQRPRRTRAYLKVEDGCDLACSFCIIPSVRGRARSRPPQEVEEEFRRLLDQGIREIVLTGVHLGHYGRRADVSLAQLVESLCKIRGDWRLRLSSLEVSELNPDLVAVLSTQDKVVPHLHLPLQSGSERILRAMRRPYRAERFKHIVELLAKDSFRPELTTDVIVGFPGESETDFQDTLDVCRYAHFSRIHIFPFSVRKGTRAESLPDHLHGSIIKERKQRLAALEDDLRRKSLISRVGQSGRVIVEKVQPDGTAEGYDERYHRNRVSGANSVSVGDLVAVIARSQDDPWLLADALETA